ncbi:MAG: TonB-dependent receptor [Acidobacteria bacterium]|nr:TonB-dependent receptor [Acidobacteriota bacterium]
MALIAAYPCAAQQLTHLSGLVVDPSEAAVRDASVTVVSEDTGFRRSASSQSDGSYVVASLQPGLYKITVRKDGFRTLIRFGVKIDVAQPARVDFQLALGSVQDAITVEGSAPLVNTDDASVGTLVDRKWIERAPLNGRGVLSLLEMAPGTLVTPATRGESGQFTANGQRPNSHYFTIDGVSGNTGVSGGGVAAQVTGGALPGMTALGSFHSLVPIEGLDEFRVQTATASSEFGRLPGAQVSLSSRAGGNEWHGSLFYYMRHDKFDANDWFSNSRNLARSPMRMNDFGASLSGPLHRDRTFFFATYEGLRLRQPFNWRQPAPTAEARTLGPVWVQTMLNLYPVPDGRRLDEDLAEWNGRILRPARLDTGSLRLDHSLTSRISVFGRFNEAPSSNQFGSTQINLLDLQSRALTFGLNLRASSTVVFDTRFNWSRSAAQSQWRPTSQNLPACYLEPVTSFFFRRNGLCDTLVRFGIAGVGTLSFGEESDRRQSQWHLLPSVAIHTRAHKISAGVDYRQLAPYRHDLQDAISILSDSFRDLVEVGTSWVSVGTRVEGSAVLREASAYVHDNWRVHPQLTASFGLRWEHTPSPRLTPEQIGTPSHFVYPYQTSIWRSSNGNFAPRAGLAWRPFSNGQLVFRGGYGFYYDSSLSIATDLVNGGPLSLAQYTSNRNAPFPTSLSFGFLPGLQLPRIRQWSFSVERSFLNSNAFSVSYTGSEGVNLLRRELGGPESTESHRLILATNHGSAVYHGLQAQVRRRFATGWQGQAGYAWGHSIDNSSSDSALHYAERGITAARDRGSSDFDVRHSFTAAMSYESPARWGRWLRGWSLDGIARARTGFPIQIQSAEHTIGIGLANAFRPTVKPWARVWLDDASAPGGRRLNRDAFVSLGELVQGSLGRNALSGFGMHQIDAALRREFRVSDHSVLHFRVEAFNMLNHPNFADPVRFLSSPLFGESPSMLSLMLGTGSPGSGLTPVFQTGGARSLQMVLRLRW